MTRTVRALLEYGVERFERAGLSYGHGTANALDEAAWIILSSLGFPPAELEAHLDRPLPEARYRRARALLGARVRTRKPAAYLLNEAWRVLQALAHRDSISIGVVIVLQGRLQGGAGGSDLPEEKVAFVKLGAHHIIRLTAGGRLAVPD